MLDDNPFLELESDEPYAEAASEGSALPSDFEKSIAESVDPVSATGLKDAETGSDGLPEGTALHDVPSDWEGDGSLDGEGWDGNDAPSSHVRFAQDEDAPSAVELAGATESLADFLHAQARLLRVSELDRYVLAFLIDNLNDDGYLEDALEDLALGLAGAQDAEQLAALMERMTLALRRLQTLEPAGVGARDLGECLRLQLLHQQRQLQTVQDGENFTLLEAALQLCSQPLELLARRDVRKLMQLCALSEAQVRAALAVIARLEPKPGRRFAVVEHNIIVPDVLVLPVQHSKADGVVQFSVQLNAEVMPRLRVHEVYASALRGHKGSDGHASLQQRLQEARWFIKNVQQRFDTILRVSQAIVERQKNFFVHGELAMRPLVLRDIAEALGVHESTVSRVTSAKYMATPHGTYELKFFFGSGLGTETGGNASSTAVRALIKQLVAAENPKKPLSDSQIADLLKEQGIECARRTVAKYREALKIAPASLRKAL